jgi:hypothetical protein
LTGKKTELLSHDDLELAKSVLSQKTLIGLTDHMEESLHRFGAYFGWEHREEWQSCFPKFSKKSSNSFEHPKVTPGSSEWEAIVRNNELDMALYQHAVHLF